MQSSPGVFGRTPENAHRIIPKLFGRCVVGHGFSRAARRTESFRLWRLRKKWRLVIPKGGVCPRNLLFAHFGGKSRSLASLGMTIRALFPQPACRGPARLGAASYRIFRPAYLQLSRAIRLAEYRAVSQDRSTHPDNSESPPPGPGGWRGLPPESCPDCLCPERRRDP
jgi:hypothetical protein